MAPRHGCLPEVDWCLSFCFAFLNLKNLQSSSCYSILGRWHFYFPLKVIPYNHGVCEFEYFFPQWKQRRVDGGKTRLIYLPIFSSLQFAALWFPAPRPPVSLFQGPDYLYRSDEPPSGRHWESYLAVAIWPGSVFLSCAAGGTGAVFGGETNQGREEVMITAWEPSRQAWLTHGSDSVLNSASLLWAAYSSSLRWQDRTPLERLAFSQHGRQQCLFFKNSNWLQSCFLFLLISLPEFSRWLIILDL